MGIVSIVSIVSISDSLLGGGRLENGGWNFGNFQNFRNLFAFLPPAGRCIGKKEAQRYAPVAIF
jgi:hypothetical protein